ncbi:hypothetical protein [Micromonospora sp. NPDC005305]
MSRTDWGSASLTSALTMSKRYAQDPRKMALSDGVGDWTISWDKW